MSDTVSRIEVNPNTVWDSSRCDEMDKLEALLHEVVAINSGNRCLERIALCISLAESLQRTDRERTRRSFVQFLNDLALKDRFPDPPKGE